MGYLGIDLGTSAVKISYVNKKLEIVKSLIKAYPIYYPQDGWAEQNPDDWWLAIETGIEELISGENFTGIEAIGVTGQMHGLVPLNKAGKVIRPAILWNDTRTAKETEFLNKEIGKVVLLQETGNIAFAGFTAPKILWLKNNEPENFHKIEHILLPKDYIVYKLSGEFSTDYSDASGTLFLDVASRKWSKKMCEICSVKEQMLPNLHESNEVVGELKPDLVSAWKLKKSPKIVAGAGDNAGAAISVGVVNEGECNISLGTSGTVFIPVNRFLQNSEAGLHAFADASGKFHLMGCTLSAASCYQWWLENILEKQEKVELSTELTYRHNSVYFMPYLMGERSPFNDETVRAGFLGLSSRTTWQHTVYAIYEGVAYSLKDCVEVAKKMGVNISKASIVGGGSKSDIWCQMIANVLQIPISKPAEECGPGYGAALLAYSCVSKLSVSEAAKQKAVFEQTFYPQQDEISYFDYKYKKFSKLYSLLKNFYR